MKKGPSESTRNSGNTTRRRRKYDEEFKQPALAMVRNGQSPRSVAEALGISENLIHRWKRASRALPQAAEDEIEGLRRRKLLPGVNILQTLRSQTSEHPLGSSL